MSDRSPWPEGQRDLRMLLKTISPVLQDGEYALCSMSGDKWHDSVLNLVQVQK